MVPIGKVVLCTALVLASIQASYNHLHINNGADHATQHHFGNVLTPHTHLREKLAAVADLASLQLEATHEKNDSVFLPWSPKQSQLDFPLVMLDTLD